MAKRQKLRHQHGKDAAMEKVFHIQELLTIPEAEKLRKLDEEMSALVHRKNISMDKKVRYYEEKLAEYRQLQDKIIKRGGVSLVDSQQGAEFNINGIEDSPHTISLLKSIVAEMMEEYKQPTAQESDDDDDESRPGSAAMYGTPAYIRGTSKPSSMVFDDTISYATALKDEEQDPEPSVPAATTTPLSAASATTGRKRKSAVSEQKMLNNILRSRGVAWKDDAVFVNVGGASQTKKQRKKQIQYKNATYDKVINFLTAAEESNIPYDGRQLVDILYDKLKSATAGVKFESMLQKFPNLKNVHESKNVVNTESWISV
jgi:hypothetical protein